MGKDKRRRNWNHSRGDNPIGQGEKQLYIHIYIYIYIYIYSWSWTGENSSREACKSARRVSSREACKQTRRVQPASKKSQKEQPFASGQVSTKG